MNSPRPYRMGFFAVWLLIGVIVAAFAVAHAKEAAAAPPAQAPEEVRLTLAQDGAVAELVSGQLLVLTLEANPSTGYLWQVDDLEPTAVRQVGVPEYVTEVSPISEDSDQLRVGAPAMAVLRFEAIAKGESTIRLAYRRPWEKGGAPLKTYSVRVRGLGEFGDVKPLPPLTPSPTVEARLKLDARGGRDLPAHFNWCEQGACTPIKDQGWCGSCWAFATVGPLESAIKIRDGVEKDLSEQYLVSCNTEGWNCQYGGSMAHDYHWWKVAQGELTAGARYETDFPYQAADVPCNAPHDAKEKLISWAMVVGANPVPTVGDLKEAIYEHGPVWAGVCVGNAFGNYTGGVFTTNENCGGGINHAIVLTGWDDSEGIWYLRNSWGEGWGENGTMRIAWGTSQVGYAANYVVYGGASACTPAETLACGQSLVGNNGGAGSTDVVDGYACTFGRNESGPEYVYSFTPDTAGYTKLSLSDLTADVDVFVLDAAAGDCGGGVCLKSGDNGVTFLAEAGRTYYVAVDGFEGAVGNYTITAQCGVGCGDAQEPNDAADQATAIAYGSSVNADICPAGDVDYYVFSGNAGDIIVADIDAWVNGSALDSYLTLYASDGVTEITANDDYDGLDSRIVYNLPSGGTYYLVVRELSHGSEGGPDYDYTLSLSVTPPPPDVISNWTSSAPTPDGYIQPGEWADAAAYDITVVRAKGERPRYAPGKEGGEVSTGRSLEALSGPRGEVRSEAVTLYVKNDATHLYLAIDNPNDTTVFEYDEMGVYFDDNPLPSDGRWTSLFCGNADGEGNFWVNPAGYWNGVAYREIIAGPDYCGIVDPAPGVSGVVGHASGHAQAELTIDLTNSALRAMPGDGIGMYLWILNSDTWMLEGQWPSVVQWDNPATYGQVRLAAPDVCVDLREPNDEPGFATGIAYGDKLTDPVICPAGDVDYYVFNGSAGDIIVADIDAWTIGSALDSYLILYAGDGVTEITANDDYDDYDDLDSRIVYNLPSGGTYYLAVRELSHGSEGGPDYYYTLSLNGGPIPVAPWSDDMEHGLNEWNADGLWHQVEDGVGPYPNSHSPTHSWWYGLDSSGNYDTGAANADALTSPAILIPGDAPNPGLRFWYWYETGGQSTDYDQRWVRISRDGGPFENMIQLSGDEMGVWHLYTVDLSAYRGSQVQLQFYFDTVDSIENDYRGWYVDDVEVLSDVPLEVGPVGVQQYVVDDDNEGGSSGNGNGVVNCGERIELAVDLLNQGTGSASAVNAMLSTADGYVTMISNTSDYPDIGANEIKTNLTPFVFSVARDAPAGHSVSFNLLVSAANGGPWQEVFQVPVSCGQAQWTFMVYLDGDNNLEGDGIDDFLEMSSVGSTADVNVVMQFDRVPGYESRYGDWTDTRRFFVAPGTEPWHYNGVSIGEANMGDPQTLIDFVTWGMTTYPAERYAVVLWDHGSGWRLKDVREPLLKDIAFDDTDWDAIDMPELRAAMQALAANGAQPLDLVGFDACLMAMIEVDNQLIPYAEVRVGSEETEPAAGWPYGNVLGALTDNPGMSASDLGIVIVGAYYASYGNDGTQSAVDLGNPYTALNTAVNNLAVTLIAKVDTYRAEIRDARTATQKFAYPSYLDLYDFASQVSQRIDDVSIDVAAASVMDAIGSAVVRERHGAAWPGAHGVSIYFPSALSGYDPFYDGDQGWLEFTAGTQWDEWLRAYYADGGTCGDGNEPNDAADQATAIAYGSSVNADICPAGDVDYYVFSGNAGDIIVADIDAWVNGSALDSYLTLYASDGVTEITANDDYDGLDSRIVYNLPSGGTYYLVVRELSHGSEGGPDYDYTLSLSVTPPPPDVISNWTSSAPTPDGYIQPGEWADAAAYDITVVRAKGERPRYAPGKEGGEVSTGRSLEALSGPRGEVRSEAVTLYVKNDATHLYLAIDNPNDTTVFEYDEMGVYFDDNPLPSDGRWTSLFCGNADGEGNFWVNPAGYWNGVAYREIIAGPDYCGIVDPAPGVSGVVGHASGHAQAELTIDLTSSALRAMPGDGIGMYLWILNSDTWMLEGQWPSVVQWDNPATYGQVRLATASPVCNEPLAPWLASPANGAGVADTTPDFDWADATHAAAYRIQVDDASDFATPVISATTTTSAFTPSTPLPPGTYYWRAQGWNNAGDCDVVGPWSTVRWLEIQPQVPNDDLGAAAVVAGLPFSRIQTTIGASLAADDPTLPCLGAWGFNSVWYRYTPPTTGQITFDTFGSSYDTVLAIWRGTRGNLTNVGCNDNSRGGLQSEVLATLQGGITYYVEIVGKTLTDQGDLSLSARSGDPAPGPACQTPTTPALATPADGASVADTTPDFDWADATHATAYRIQVDDASDFATPVISAATTASAFTPSTPLPPGTYYWRAQGWNNAGGCDLVGPWSAARSLRIWSSLYLPVVIKR
jgi:predicted secreted protein